MAARLPRCLGLDMTDLTVTTKAPLGWAKRMPGWVWLYGAVASIFAAITLLILQANPDVEPHFRVSLAPILASPTIVQVHIGTALTAFMVGLVLMLSPKGMKLHKTLGWTWVCAMALTAGTSFFMTGLIGSMYSPIHALSAWTALGLPFGIAAIRKGDVKTHRKQMTGMYLGGMVIAGVFAFLPGRLLWSVFFAA